MVEHKIVVTGGAGYIGSHLCKHLSKRQSEVTVIDNLVNGHKSACKWGSHLKIDINNHSELLAAFKKTNPSVVFHFAAFTNVGESAKEPQKYYENNVSGTLSLLEAMRKTNCKKIIFSSSAAVYGVPNKVPITEDEAKLPINTYGFTKFVMERAIEDYSSAFGFQGVHLRYFNAAGADPEGELGENHNPETHLIPLIFMALRDGKPITVFGKDYDTDDGTCVRDYIHVSDLAEAHYLALNYLDKGGRTTGINLGTGKGNSVLEVIKCVEKVSGQRVLIEYGSRRPGDPPRLVASPDKSKSVLGWTPKYTNLDETIGHAWHWFQKSK
ncbi:MAG: UDP-glucose 4-epimerase GalE [Pseudomonadota bacterium]|nr:UDP-glucose 4-epimerase GalE [Pseudomonadota bacterium]